MESVRVFCRNVLQLKARISVVCIINKLNEVVNNYKDQSNSIKLEIRIKSHTLQKTIFKMSNLANFLYC